jgi:S1-C subfamily serine protease
VEAGSIAADSGLKPGDRIVSLEGQPLLSTADLQWILHHAASEDALAADIRRGDKNLTIEIELPAGWRRESDISFRATTWDLRRMGSGGLLLADLGDEERKQRKLPKDTLALFVKHVGEYGAHAAAKRAGFQKGDVIVAVDGKRDHWTEGQFLQYALALPPGTKVTATVRRGEKEIELKLPMQK